MMFLKLSLLNNLLCIIVMAIMAFSTNVNAEIKWHSSINHHLSNCLVPFHYNLKLKLMIGYEYSGESNATIYINCPMQNMILHILRHMIILKIKLIKSANRILTYTPSYSFRLYKENIVVLDSKEALLENSLSLECGVYILNVKFSNVISFEYSKKALTDTWRRYEIGRKPFIFATLIQPRRAQKLLFPNGDEPQLNATFNLSVEHHINYKVLSNMPIREYEPVDDFTRRALFHETPRMSSNDIAILMFNDEVDDVYHVLNSTQTIAIWCRPHLISQLKFALYVAGNVTIYLENNWEILKSVPKVDYVAIPKLNKTQQAWGLTLYNEADIIYKEKLYSAAFKTVLMRSITHDIIYQWFGDLFNPSCRSNWWLNEGFILFIETYIMDKVFPDSRMMDLFVVQIQHESRHINTYYDIHYFAEYASDIPEINALPPFSRIMGAIVWCMLKHIIPENTFWFSIKMYLNEQFTFFTSKNPDDLWDVMHSSNEYYFKLYGLNIKEITNIWSVQKHCPVLNVTLDYHSGHMKISKEFDDKSEGKPYFIPVSYTKDADADFNLTLPYIHDCLTKSTPELKILFTKKDKWIIVNKQQAGYYRVNYDPQNWQGIARYLNSTEYTKIHVLNRAQIIDDAFHFAIERKLNFSIFWELASYLSREKDYIAWYPMIKIFEYISNIFAFSGELQDELPKELKEVLVKIRSIFEHIEGDMYNQTVSTNHDFNKYLKQELAKWACIIGNSICMEKAKNQLQLFLRNNTINKILPGWQKWTYCNGLKTANHGMWLDVWINAFYVYKKKHDYKILEYLNCFENHQIIFYHLDLSIPLFESRFSGNNENKTRKKERISALTANMFLSTLARHTKNTTILEELLTKFESIKNRYYSQISIHATLNVIINNAYTKRQLTKIDEFAKDKMTQSYSIIKSKINTRSIELKNQLTCLESLFDVSKNNTIRKIIYGTTGCPPI